MKTRSISILFGLILLVLCMFVAGCGDSPCEHTWNEGEVAKAATCTTAGEKVFTCTSCQETKTEEIPATGHTEVADDEVKPTCISVGKTAGSHCSVCNTVLVEQQEIDALGHTWDNGAVTTEPTCAATGVKTYTCTVCTATKTESITKIATHGTLKLVAKVDPTCTEIGFEEHYECTLCGQYFAKVLKEDQSEGYEEKTFKDFAIPATGHTPVTDAAVPATCATPGKTEGSHCAVCNTVLVEQKNILPIDHTYGGVVKEQPKTCTEDGVKAFYQCLVCGQYFDNDTKKAVESSALVIPKGHTVVTDAAIPATCTKTGKTEGSHCSVCGETIVAQTTTDALGHQWSSGTTTPGTCATKAVTTYTCTRCGGTKTEEGDFDPTNHEGIDDALWEETTEATCVAKGSEKNHCTACDSDVYRDIPIAKDNHSLEVYLTVTATCVQPAQTYYQCTREGCSYVTVETGSIDPDNHDWDAGQLTKAANCVEVSETTHTCKRNGCDESYIEYGDTLNPDNHKIVETVEAMVPATCTTDGHAMIWRCTACNAGNVGKVDVYTKTGHLFGDQVLAKDPTCTEEGNVAYYHCSRCNKNYSDNEQYSENVIENVVRSALPHTLVERAKITGTEERPGRIAHWHCTVCGKNFSDAAGTEEILGGPVAVLTEGDQGHTYEWDESAQSYHCTECASKYINPETFEIVTEVAHVHSLQHITISCESETCACHPVTDYWWCTTCGKNFTDNPVENPDAAEIEGDLIDFTAKNKRGKLLLEWHQEDDSNVGRWICRTCSCVFDEYEHPYANDDATTFNALGIANWEYKGHEVVWVKENDTHIGHYECADMLIYFDKYKNQIEPDAVSREALGIPAFVEEE